ncbi:MAG: DUF928 domain-containing protein [Cyanobacteria bacterium P01_A01_bin.116]
MIIGVVNMVGVLTTTVASVASSNTNSVSPNPSSEVSVAAQRNETLRQGLPGRRIGGGTRGDRIFASTYAYLTALVTSDNVNITTAAQPTLLFYVPEMTASNEAEFVLRDANDELVYASTLQLEPAGGIVSIETAESLGTPEMAMNENYRWYFSIVPDATDRSKDIVVHGAIRRVDPSEWLAANGVDPALQSQLSSLAPLEKAKVLYQQANMWHEAAVILDQLRQADPKNTEIVAEWTQLLDSAGIATIAQTEPSLNESSENVLGSL